MLIDRFYGLIDSLSGFVNRNQKRDTEYENNTDGTEIKTRLGKPVREASTFTRISRLLIIIVPIIIFFLASWLVPNIVTGDSTIEVLMRFTVPLISSISTLVYLILKTWKRIG